MTIRELFDLLPEEALAEIFIDLKDVMLDKLAVAQPPSTPPSPPPTEEVP